MSSETETTGRVGVALVALALASCSGSPLDRAPRHLVVGAGVVQSQAHSPFGRCDDHDPLRRPFFGDLHIHTSYSLDANLEGTRLDPGDAYRFATGHTVYLPPFDADGNATRGVRIDRPLDFAAVTDHAEFLGVIAACEDPENPGYGRIGCWIYRRLPDYAFLILNLQNASAPSDAGYPQLCGEDGKECEADAYALWSATQAEAERYYDRTSTCGFTTFIGYEWSASPRRGLYQKVQNLHRNVIFRGSAVPRLPISYLDAPDVEDLWRRLRDECFRAGTGCDVLTIPHNANLSAGAMFEPTRVDGAVFDRRYAARRRAMEPLMEIYQHKGQSECIPGGFGADELCHFDILPYDNLSSAKRGKLDPLDPRSTMRHGFGEGLRYGARIGVNPFEHGIISSTDNHLALGGGVNESTFLGGGGAGEGGGGTADGDTFPDRIYFGAGGLAAVWAEENSRPALFDAMRRRETFGTSGPRMSVRTFTGWDLPDAWCDDPERDRTGYRHGVPMGGVLEWTQGVRDRAPRIAVNAVFDPGTDALPGAKLQRVQVVKGWLDAETGDYQVRVVDVAGDPEVGRPTAITDCSPPEDGFSSLCAVWTDDDFDPSEPAYWYVRVLEVPTCRWTTRMCVAARFDCENPTRPIDAQCCAPGTGLHAPSCLNAECGPENLDDPCCQATVVEPMVQERAWTSPVWYRPSPFSSRSLRTPADPVGPVPFGGDTP